MSNCTLTYPENYIPFTDPEFERALATPGFARKMLAALRDRGVRYEGEPPGGFTDAECAKILRIIYDELRGRENPQ